MSRDPDDDRYDDRRDDVEEDRPRRRRRRDDYDDGPPPKKGMSTGVILAIVFGALVVLGVPCALVMIGLLLPAVQKVREAAGRQVVTNNGKQLAIASLNSHDTVGKYRGPFVDVDGTGRPFDPPANPDDRLSWRVGLLPYMQQENLYRQFQLTEPWNSPANMPHASVPVKPYLDPADPTSPPQTRYRAFYDNGAIFDSNPAARVSMREIQDGTSNTILFVEAAEPVGWTQFNDFRFNPAGTPPPMGHPSRNTFMAVMADGSVRMVSKGVSPQMLNAAITRGGGEAVNLD